MQRAAANASTSTATASTNLAQREVRKKVIERELKITKTSTASLGKFDDKLKGEKKEKNVKRKVRLWGRPLLPTGKKAILTSLPLARPRSLRPTRPMPGRSERRR